MMKLTILVSGMISAVPWQGGATWAVLQYLLGFRRLGHEVYFVEPIDSNALLPPGTGLAESENARYSREVMGKFGFEHASALLVAGTRQTVGLGYDEGQDVSRRADLLVNISGLLTDPGLVERIPTRVYVDLDPAFTQLWHFTQGIDLHLAGHTHVATVGLGLLGTQCRVPTGGLDWITTPPPVVLECWPVTREIRHDALTTVANWRSYGSVEYDGVQYGQKAHSLRRLIDLPTRTSTRCRLALAIHPAEKSDLFQLERNRWEIVDPLSVTSTPGDYAAFVRGSWAELGVAKSGYVDSNSGWFSDRSVCYLASGRPVIAQDTGFSRWLPTGDGLLRFETVDDAVEAIEDVRSAYSRHAAAARSIAETYFDSDRVLSRLLQRLGSTP
jgi:hypothetical protein